MERFTDSDDAALFTITLKNREEAKMYIYAGDMLLALGEMKEYLRSIRKYHDEKSGLDYKTIEKIEDEFLNIINNYNLEHII